ASPGGGDGIWRRVFDADAFLCWPQSAGAGSEEAGLGVHGAAALAAVLFRQLRGCAGYIANHPRRIYKLRIVARTGEGFAWFFHIRRSRPCVRCSCWTPSLALAPSSSASIGPDVPIIQSFPVG